MFTSLDCSFSPVEWQPGSWLLTLWVSEDHMNHCGPVHAVSSMSLLCKLLNVRSGSAQFSSKTETLILPAPASQSSLTLMMAWVKGDAWICWLTHSLTQHLALCSDLGHLLKAVLAPESPRDRLYMPHHRVLLPGFPETFYVSFMWGSQSGLK